MPTPQRTDVHRPGAMKPADYRVLAYACVISIYDAIEGRDLTVCELEPVSGEWEELGCPTASTWGAHREGQCDHCGARVKHQCVVIHAPTGDILTVGRDCVGRFFDVNWSHFEQVVAARLRRVTNRTDFLRQYPHAAPAVAWAEQEGHKAGRFVCDILEKATVKGYHITGPQVAAFIGAYERTLKPVEYKTGRRAIEGTIAAVKFEKDPYKSDRYGTAYKVSITVQTPEGLKVFGTLPGDYASGLRPDDEARLMGRRVTFTATVQAKRADFATYARPSGFALEARPGGGVCGDVPMYPSLSPLPQLPELAAPTDVVTGPVAVVNPPAAVWVAPDAPTAPVPAPTPAAELHTDPRRNGKPAPFPFPDMPADDAPELDWRMYRRGIRVPVGHPNYNAYVWVSNYWYALEDERDEAEEAARNA